MIQTDNSSAAFSAYMAGRKVRLQCPVTGDFLHLTGAGRTRGEDYAWLGTRTQAQTLRERAIARGEDWPWRAVRPGEGENP